MGLLSWLFPSEEDRVARARKLLASERWVDARDEVLDIDRDDAREVIAEADRGLVRANLAAAISWGAAGDDARVQQHLQLAEEYHHGGLEDELRETRRRLRETRAERRADDERAKAERDSRLLSVDPLGLTGGPSLLDAPAGDLTGMDDEETAARLALLIEAYPAALRSSIGELGGLFTRAVLDIEDGRPDLALPALMELPDEQALVRWERSRAAYILGDPAAAVKELRAFAERAGGHFEIGRSHSGALLAQYTAEAGDVSGALRIMRGVRATEPKVGGPLFAELLEANGELAEAEDVLRRLIGEHPRADMLYRMLARVRVRGGHREQAMAALESAMKNVCDTPGRCGYKPPDRAIVRDLATLYLEGDYDRERGLELADQARQLPVERTDWQDAYLEGLVARLQGAPAANEIATSLQQNLPQNHPARDRVARYLPVRDEEGPRGLTG